MILLSALWVAMSIVGDIAAKKAISAHNTVVWTLAAAAIWALTALPAYAVYRQNDFGAVTVIWAAFSVLLGIACSVLVFGEPLGSRRAIAAALTIFCVWLARD